MLFNILFLAGTVLAILEAFKVEVFGGVTAIILAVLLVVAAVIKFAGIGPTKA